MMCFSRQVVLLDLEVLSEISSNPTGFIMPPGSSDGTVVSPERASFSDVKLNPYFFKLMNGLIDWFKKDKQLLEDRGAFIIR